VVVQPAEASGAADESDDAAGADTPADVDDAFGATGRAPRGDAITPPDVRRPGGAARVDYGIDAERAVVRLTYGSLGAGLVMVFGAIAHAPVGLSIAAFAACVGLALAALTLTWSSRVGKVRERVRLVGWLELPADAYVLDAGCGPGAVLVEAALRNPEGLAVGVDLWRVCEPALPRANAKLEGVDDHVALATGNVTDLPFADATFDVVSCSLVLRRLDGSLARLASVREAARVLVPGGRLVVLDTAKTRQIAVAMRATDLVGVTRSRRVWRLVPPARYVTGRKPGA
jgi:SAM-dependent methyltransferase